MKSFIKNLLLITILIGIIFIYFKEYKPKIEKYNKLKSEEQEIIKELNALKMKVDSMSNKKQDNIDKYTYESIQKELKTDSIRVWKTGEGLKFEVNDRRIFMKNKSLPTKEGEKMLEKLLSNITNVKGNIKIEVLLDSLDKNGKLKIDRSVFIMNQMIRKYGINRNDVEINILLVKKGLSGINIELR
ncbi:MAG TPA: hypothetical protein ENJ25_02585 [Firmicutes bacterium]|uniref:OmpA-like domain-containing protein n=1 Tax=candidate division TA06 bacterium TaxID=2250710 RepID=A0A660SD69_UNCT6|nr:MAG: hypothetical protein DRP44_01005 [candidate division TA06 bacterium]HFD05013.1 hypothetical protein [Bacillota bacterium]